ncbi:MAG: replication-associated recombination protein A [Nanoarchaeota archaeon]
MEKLSQPLAHRMRPRNISEFFGQEHLIGEGKPLRVAIETGELPASIIFWGPPGCGKTTLARIIANSIQAEFIELSAVNAGKEDIIKAVNKTRLAQRKTVLFLDEIHRFNKVQQDALLPHVEKGTLTLIGATTENPSFEIISALLSRTRVFVLNELKEDALVMIIDNALKEERGLANVNLEISEEDKSLIANLANGDARAALNILEIVSNSAKKDETGKIKIKRENILYSAQKFLRYDKNGEEHYNIISALHKSMRDSDAQAAVYWTMRMLEAGEDPLYLARRMARFASEDVGNADPNALVLAVAAKEAVDFIGMPEANTALVQLATYLAGAPKDNSAYKAVLKAKEVIKETGNLPVPFVIRNAPTTLMKQLGYGKGYKYAHDYSDAKVEQQHLPKEIKDVAFYEEKDEGEKLNFYKLKGKF